MKLKAYLRLSYFKLPLHGRLRIKAHLQSRQCNDISHSDKEKNQGKAHGVAKSFFLCWE